MPTVGIPFTPNPQKDQPFPSTETKRGRAMLFQITDPTNQPILQYALALHVNPNTFGERFTKSKTTVQTYGGYVEWIWPDELDAISANASTGAFMGPDVGLTAGSDGSSAPSTRASHAALSGRHGTIAWERQEDLLDLFRSNGVIFNGQGLPVLHGNVMCMYDRGIYTGYFTSFEVKEDDEHPFSFELSWEFKVLATIYNFPGSGNSGSTGFSFLNQGQSTVDRLAAEQQAAEQARQNSSNNGPAVPSTPSGVFSTGGG